MTEALVLIVLVWAGMLVSGALRSRSASPHVTVGGFERAMDVLRSDNGMIDRGGRRDGRTGRRLLVPSDAGRIVERPVDDTLPPNARLRGEDPLLARRRMWFERAVAVSGLSLVLGVAFGGWLWIPTAMVWAVTAAYVTVLRRLKLQRDEAKQVVRELELDRDDVRTLHVPDDVAVGAGSLGSASAATGGSVRLRRWGD